MSKKRIIYLDQNFFSDMAKLQVPTKKSNVNAEIPKLFDLIKEGVDREAFVVPDSTIQSMETARLSPELKDLVRSHQGYLGQLSLKRGEEVKTNQFTKALLEYCKIDPPDVSDWDEAFEKNPDSRIENMRINADSGLFFVGSNSDIEDIQKIRDSGVIESEQYKKEITAQRDYYKKRIREDLRYLLDHHGISIEQAKEFIDSQSFAEIPNIFIFCTLWSKSLSDKTRKKRRQKEILMIFHFYPRIYPIAIVLRLIII